MDLGRGSAVACCWLGVKAAGLQFQAMRALDLAVRFRRSALTTMH